MCNISDNGHVLSVICVRHHVAYYCRYTGLDITRFVKFCLYGILKLPVSQPGISLQGNYSVCPSSAKRRITTPD